jgi:hypothetical protein
MRPGNQSVVTGGAEPCVFASPGIRMLLPQQMETTMVKTRFRLASTMPARFVSFLGMTSGAGVAPSPGNLAHGRSFALHSPDGPFPATFAGLPGQQSKGFEQSRNKSGQRAESARFPLTPFAERREAH